MHAWMLWIAVGTGRMQDQAIERPSDRSSDRAIERSIERPSDVLEPSWGVLRRLGGVLETSWSLQSRPKIVLGGIFYRKCHFCQDWSPSSQGWPLIFEGFWVSKAVKMEPNLSQNWDKNMTSNKDSFINPHRQVFERKLTPKSSTFLVNNIATRNII